MERIPFQACLAFFYLNAFMRVAPCVRGNLQRKYRETDVLI